MEFYIARDKNGCLNLYFAKPTKLEKRGFFIGHLHPNTDVLGCVNINKKEFPEVTWENSPKKVRIELIDY